MPDEKKANQQTCESCRFWGVADLSLKGIGNFRPCLWAMPRSGDFYAKTLHAPPWTQDLAHQTASYEGEQCGVYERRPKK